MRRFTNSQMFSKMDVFKLTNMILFAIASLLALTRAQQSLSYVIQEEQPAPVTLGNIGTSANITPRPPDLSFTLLTRADDGGNLLEELFEVDGSTGDLHTRKPIDRETLPQCNPTAACILTASVVVSSPSTSLIQRFTLNITVVDANDQRPQWTSTPLFASFSERQNADSTIVQLPLAEDSDYEPLFKVQRYTLEPVSLSATFGLDMRQKPNSNEFDMYLKLKRKLDRELQDSYNLTLVAWDGEGPAYSGRLPIILTVTDDNDNAPQFLSDKYTKTVQDVTPPGSSVLTVSATDEDVGENSRVSYEIPSDVNKRVLELFRVDPITGELTLNQSLGKETSLTFRVRAFDHGANILSTDVEVVITVEDTLNDPPSLSISHTDFDGEFDYVREDASINSVVAFVDVTDNDNGDNGRVNCWSQNDYFNLKENGGFAVVVDDELDREKDDEHTVVIMCEDHGSPALTSSATLKIRVKDVNDNAPEFTKTEYRLSIRENQQKDVLVGSVHAVDKDIGDNGNVRYSLPPNVTEFEINAKGFIYTAARNLDREDKDTYRFDVYAFDMAVPPRTATASVVVVVQDLNDEWPTFDRSSYNFRISESAKVGDVVGKFHAQDKDLAGGGVVEYILVPSLQQQKLPFHLHQSNGLMTVDKDLDFEEEKQYKFVVTAIDMPVGEPRLSSTVEVVVDILDENDNSPAISFPTSDNLSVTLNLGVIPGHEVIQVIAHDDDSGENGRLRYFMSAADNSSDIADRLTRLFWMNEDTGMVTLVSPLNDIDVLTYNIVVTVQDNGTRPQRSTQALLLIQVVKEVDPDRHRESYTTIVIAMVCVTLVVAVVVLLILCFIKYSDRRRYEKEKKSAEQLHHIHGDHQIHNGTSAVFEPVPSKYDVFTLENSNAGDGSGDHSIDTLDRSDSPSSFQKQPLTAGLPNRHIRPGSLGKPSKKSVTFDSEVRTSDTCNPNSSKLDTLLLGETAKEVNDLHSLSSHYPPTLSTAKIAPSSPGPNSMSNPKMAFGGNNMVTVSNPNTHYNRSQPNDSRNSSVSWPSSSTSTFRPGAASSPSPLPTSLDNQPAYPVYPLPPRGSSAQHANGQAYPQTNGLSSPGAHRPQFHTDDEVVGMALQKHNALVRSMRGNNRRPPYASRQVRRTSGNEADICSSSSVETTDSGHGGSELDVSVIKAAV